MKPQICRTRIAPLLVPILMAAAAPAAAVLDVEDRGPVLDAGDFGMRITNAGILGNAFADNGRSSDPSFEYPIGSGNECLKYAALWVGARDLEGIPHVSGGPLLEWRPTPDPEDRVRTGLHGLPGTKRFYDDDGDGLVDEETLNGRDDDGDGEIDEDLGIASQQLLAADYVDNRPEAIRFFYGGEPHVPLGLSVHQEAYAWSMPGYRGTAGVQFIIRNVSDRPLRDVYVGLLADLDSRRTGEPADHFDDRIRTTSYARDVFDGAYLTRVLHLVAAGPCIAHLSGAAPVLVDGDDPQMPVVAVIGLDHTIDPLGLIYPSGRHAPATVAFKYSLFANGRPPSEGGVPGTDAERFAALAGERGLEPGERRDDYVVLVSCGPFPLLLPHESIRFDAALVASPALDTMRTWMGNIAYLEHGTQINLLPDSTAERSDQWYVGETGINGHEACVAAPPGVTFDWDPHCPHKFAQLLGEPAGPRSAVYTHDRCIWTDADCDICTGNGGNETVVRWLDPGVVPPAPGFRAVPGDHQVRIEWDNTPEILVGAGPFMDPGVRFLGYRVYKLADWRKRSTLMPPRESWAMLGEFGSDSSSSAIPLAAVTDTAIRYARILYEQPQYPIGRYVLVDREALDGFTYGYVVTSVVEARRFVGNFIATEQLESALNGRFGDVVAPHATGRPDASSVWVVPNPFRAKADWDLPPVSGDPHTRHIDFLGLPRARSTIRIWTVAGDFVAQVDHDGTAGDGQASWNLISRNGQEVESGIYLFTVDSALGRSVGRFVVIR